jgi:hypothetical protein
MLSEDTEVWTEFLKQWPWRIDEVWYDVKVGAAAVLADKSDVMLYKIAVGVTRKRIDVVCRVKRNFWIVEIKPYAGYVAFGQVIMYRDLFVREYEIAGYAQPVVVCFEVDPDLLPEFNAAGVSVLTVEHSALTAHI